MRKGHKENTTLMNVNEAQMELLRRKAECKYNEGVICGLWEKDPDRCARCNWNPNKGKSGEGIRA